MYTRAALSIFLSRDRFVTHFWTGVLQKNIIGFPTLGGLPSCVRTEQDLQHALWLLRLSYIRYALKTDHDPRRLFEQESECLQLSPRFASLLAQFLPAESALASDAG